MEPRLLQLLRIVVDEYVANAEPVGSQFVVESHDLGVSSATVRNWFALLEEEECLVQPHTSGGRIPTEKGFRLYIEHFVPEKLASKKEREALERAALMPADDGRRLKSLAKSLAELSGLAAFAGLSEADTYYTGLSQLFAQPEFRDSQRVINLSEILDHLDETLAVLRDRSFIRPQILLGQDCPFGPSCGAIIVSHGTDLIGLLGPLRMDYGQARALMISALNALHSS